MAWHSLGWVPSFFSEIEAFPRAVLENHYPEVPVHGDFTTIGADDYGSIDLLVGGTPCQSFSVAGLRGGMADERGNLALEYLKLAQRKRPRWLVWENVPGVLSSNGGRDFGAFLGGLVECGYGFAYRVLDAQYFGVAQRRRRVFVVGYLGDWRRAAAVLFERHSLQGHPAPSREKGERIAPTSARGTGERGTKSRIAFGADLSQRAEGVGFQEEVAACLAGNHHPGHGAHVLTCAEVAPAVTTGPPFSRTGNERVECEAIVRVTGPLTAGSGRVMAVAFAQNSRDEVREMPYSGALSAQPGMKQTSYVREGLSVRRLTPTECERLQGFPDNFTQIPYRNKSTANCPDGPRYKALGNSMAVPVMRWIGERINEVSKI